MYTVLHFQRLESIGHFKYVDFFFINTCIAVSDCRAHGYQMICRTFSCCFHFFLFSNSKAGLLAWDQVTGLSIHPSSSASPLQVGGRAAAYPSCQVQRLDHPIYFPHPSVTFCMLWMNHTVDFFSLCCLFGCFSLMTASLNCSNLIGPQIEKTGVQLPNTDSTLGMNSWHSVSLNCRGIIRTSPDQVYKTILVFENDVNLSSYFWASENWRLVWFKVQCGGVLTHNY